jgi:hypothetical protein
VSAIYAIIPKWLLLILVVLLLGSSGYLWTKMKYYQSDNRSLEADQKLLTENNKVLTANLDTCTKAIAAGGEHYQRTDKIDLASDQYRKRIEDLCKKRMVCPEVTCVEGKCPEIIGVPDDKTDLRNAIGIHNDLILRAKTGN